MTLLRLLVIAACIAIVLSVEKEEKVEKGDRDKPRTEADFQDQFKDTKGPASNANGNAVLSTTKVGEAYNASTNQLLPKITDILTAKQIQALNDMKNLTCPDGPKVFNLTNVTLRRALLALDLLNPLMTTPPAQGQGQGTPPTPNNPAKTADSGVRFLAAVCVTNETRPQLVNNTRDVANNTKMRTFHPALLALLSDEVARRAAAALPEDMGRMVCDRLKMADTSDLLDLARVFPCKQQLKELADEDPVVAEALLQEERKKKPADVDWDGIMKDFGGNVPRDMLESAPADKVKKHLSEVLDENTAPTVLPKIDFRNMNASDVTSLGDKTCSELPLSSVLNIPKEALEGAGNATTCVGKGDNSLLKRKMAQKLLPARNSTTCKKFLKDVDPMDKKCWEQLSQQDVQNFDFKGVNKSEVSCEMAAALRQKLGLNGSVSTWSTENLQKYAWVVKCAGAASMAADEVTKIAQAAAQGQVQVADLRPSVNRKVFKQAKEELGNLTDATKLTKVKDLMGAMTPADLDQLSPNLVTESLPQLKEYFSKMPKPSRRKLMDKMQPNQLKEQLCNLGQLEEDVPADTVMQMTDLGQKLTQEDCGFRCHTDEQCSVIYTRMKENLAANNLTWDNAPRDVLQRARATRAICGMPVADVTELSADAHLKDVAAAFFKANCSNMAVAQVFADKVVLFKKFVEKTNTSVTDVQMLGGEFFKELDSVELQNYTTEVKKSIIQALGQADLTDVDGKWLKNMTAIALKTVLANENGDIDSTAVLWLGGLLCGLNETQAGRLWPDALLDAAEILDSCPDHSLTMKVKLRQEMKNKRNLAYSSMGVDDLSLGGTLFLTDCANLDQIPDAVKSEAVSDMVQAAGRLREKRQRQNETLSDPDGTRATQQAQVEDQVKCGLRKMVEARARSRAQPSAQGRRRRSTVTMTCADIQILGEYAIILTPQDITDLSNSDFNDCADALGTVTGWTQQQKDALANKAKQVWGAVATWTVDDRLLTAGTIIQGLTPADLNNMALTLNHLSALGQHAGWTSAQLEAGFSKVLSSVGGQSSSVTADHLRQIGHFACGATVQHIASFSSLTYSGAASEVGDLTCDIQKMEAWAALAVKAFGPVSGWTLPQSAAVDRVMIGLTGEQLSQLTPTQLSFIDRDAFAMIPGQKFANLTVAQIRSLSTNQAQSVTSEQYRYLSTNQKQALAEHGLSYTTTTSTTNPSGTAAKGAAVAIPLLLIMLSLTVLLSNN